MRKIIIALAIIVIIGCANDDSSNYSDAILKVYDWQEREAYCNTITTECYLPFGNFESDLIWFLGYALPNNWNDHTEEVDYWQTSCESSDLLEGDCEDMAIYTYRIIKDSCLIDFYDDVDVRLLLYEHHMVTVIYHEGETYQISNFIRLHSNESLNGDFGKSLYEFDEEYIF